MTLQSWNGLASKLSKRKTPIFHNDIIFYAYHFHFFKVEDTVNIKSQQHCIYNHKEDLLCEP